MELSKKNKGVLIGFIVILYGLIAFLAYGKFFSTSTAGASGDDMQIVFSPKAVSGETSFTIENNHRDPFLNKPRRETSQVQSEKRTTATFKKPSDFPVIKYLGSITDAKGKNGRYAVAINNKEFIMRRGEQKEGITLINANASTIIVLWKGQRTIIELQK